MACALVIGTLLLLGFVFADCLWLFCYLVACLLFDLLLICVHFELVGFWWIVLILFGL